VKDRTLKRKSEESNENLHYKKRAENSLRIINPNDREDRKKNDPGVNPKLKKNDHVL